MPIVFRCDCGKKLQVKDQSAGKTCVCPGCGDKLSIPSESSEQVTKVPKKAPLPKTVSLKKALPQETEDYEPAPRRKAGERKKPRSVKAEPRVLWPWIAGGGVALAVVVGLSLWLILRKPAKEPDKTVADNKNPPVVVPNNVPKVPENAAPASDLDLIPADALGFAAVQLGNWWDSPAGKKLQQQIAPLGPNDLVEQSLGISPDNIQRLSFVVTGNSGCTIVSAKSPITREKVLATLAPNSLPRTEGGKSYYVGARENAVYFAGDRLFVFGDLRSVRGLMEHTPSSTSGPLAEAVRLTDKHLIVVAVNPDAKEVQDAKRQFPPEMKQQYAALLQMRRAALTVDLEDDLKIHLSVEMADAAQASAAKPQVNALIALARLGVNQFTQGVPPARQDIVKPGIVLIDSLLRSVKIEQQAAKLDVDLQTEKGVLTDQVNILVPAIQKVRDSAQKMTDQNNLRQLALALHIYHDTFQFLPAAAICGPDGKPLLSWRVAILPFVEQVALYQQFHLNESWDSPHNIKLLEKMPKVFASPSAEADKPFTTHYRVFSGDQALFPARTRPGGTCLGRRLSEIADGTSNTMMIVEAADAVPWTKPEELPYNPQGPLPKLGVRPNSFHMAFADGSVRQIPGPLDERRFGR